MFIMYKKHMLKATLSFIMLGTPNQKYKATEVKTPMIISKTFRTCLWIAKPMQSGFSFCLLYHISKIKLRQ